MSGKSGRRLPAAACATAGQFAYEPVRRRTRPTRSPSRSTMHDRRAARALDAADADRASVSARHRRPRAHGAVEQAVEDVEARKQLERALLEPRLDVAGRRGGAPPARSRRRRDEGSSCGASSATPAARAAGPTAPSAAAVAASTTPMSGIRSMNEPLKRSACQARDDSARIRASVSRASRDGRAVEVEGAAADRDRAEQEPVTGEPLRSAAGRRRRARRSGSCRRPARRRRRSRRCR